jgi:hypothetical protein
VRNRRDLLATKLKSLSIAAGLVASCCLAVSLNADEGITCQSPDGKFALRHVYSDREPYNGDTAIIEVATRKNVWPLDSNWGLGEHGRLKLLWSGDSQRVAYWAANAKGSSARVFFRNDSSFAEIKLPELPSPKLPANAATESGTDITKRIEPMQWLKSGDLVLESELLNPGRVRAALKINVAFDAENRALVGSVEQEKASIIDYFLLLPEEFEGPPLDWLRYMRTGGSRLYVCDPKPPSNLIDEKNGYMECDGWDAPGFEVALFRHRDGRPLLALCSGEVKADDSVTRSVNLHFFELGADKKMHEIKRSIFPFSDSGYDPDRRKEKGNWYFDLPREGRTVIVRARKSRRVLHKITWNGEKFQEAK